MSISIKRALQCVGRRVKHTSLDLDGKEIKGVVVGATTGGFVRIESADQSQSLCDPENLNWDDRGLSADLMEAIREDTWYRSPQVWYDPTEDDPIGYLGSSSEANDDGRDHLLYVILPLVQQVHPVTPLANRELVWAIEEALGWAEP